MLTESKDLDARVRGDRVAAFKARFGDLEIIRQELGLSKKEISDLLWVEPSAWTRWTTGVSRPPDHIYRSLQWYLELRQVSPSTQFLGDLEALRDNVEETRRQFGFEIQTLREKDPRGVDFSEWQNEKAALLAKIESGEKLSFGWKFTLLICLLLTLFNLLY